MPAWQLVFSFKPTGASVCLNNDVIQGPFPDGRLQVSISNPPGLSSGCFSGSSFDSKYGVCTDADNAYGPFPRRLVQSCLRSDGGPVCESQRWSKTFLGQQIRLAQPLQRDDYPVEIRGVYVSHYVLLSHTDAEIIEIAKQLVQAHVNTVYLSVYSIDGPQWPSAAYAQAGGEIPSENRATRWAHLFRMQGLRPVAWFEYGLRLGAANHPIAVAHPDWLQRDSGSSAISREGGSVFLSPGNPGAVQMVVNMATELAQVGMEFDEIHLDHFHWSYTVSGREFGYEKSSAWLYYLARKRSPSSNVNDPDWVAFRENLLDEAVRKMYASVKNNNPRVTLSACPEAVYALTKHMKKWQHWLEGGYIDSVTPQMYFDNISDFQDQLATLQGLAFDAVNNAQTTDEKGVLSRFGVGIDATSIHDEKKVEQMIRAAKDAGVNNVILWSYHDYGEGISVLDNLSEQSRPGHVWAEPALQPFD